MAIHYFNPETDLELALNTNSYTLPKKIGEMKSYLALLPSILAEKSDFILLNNKKEAPSLPYYDIVLKKKIQLLDFSDLKTLDFNSILSLGNEANVFHPWGWNKIIVNELLSYGVPSKLLPSVHWLENFKELSHRKTTISFFNHFKERLSLPSPVLTAELDEAMEAIRNFGEACIKAPWSSSGRGVMFTNQINEETTINRLASIIKAQGSVIIEKFYKKKLDCATEWYLSPGSVNFLGYSVFETDSHGCYLFNIIDEEDRLEKLIRSNLKEETPDFLSMHKSFLCQYILPFYNGPLGIDMLVTDSGILNPCVEFNFRNTMGHVAIRIKDLIEELTHTHEINSFPYLKEIKETKKWRVISKC